MSIKWEGVQQVTANMRRSARGARSGAVKATRKVGRTVFDQSQDLVPVRTSALKNSGHLSEHLLGRSFSVVITYDTPYAVYVHEDLNMRHAPGKSAKFVEIPLNAALGWAMPVYKFYVDGEIEKEVHR